MECSERLRTGEYVNGGNSDCSCFMKVSNPLGSKGNALQPYVSIAANDISYESKVFVHQLNGIVLANGKIHNGCVRVDDVSWSFDGNHIDFYVLRKSNYEMLSPRVDGQVDITLNSNCVIKSY
ncbi:unnamed protein product [Rotaria sp. Silwood1]|nr:unnamed protein product [Rotaria sp. Silwood1]